MPDSYGKRQRDAVKARKAAAREERRIARRQRRGSESGASGVDSPEDTLTADDTEQSQSVEVPDLSDSAT